MTMITARKNGRLERIVRIWGRRREHREEDSKRFVSLYCVAIGRSRDLLAPRHRSQHRSSTVTVPKMFHWRGKKSRLINRYQTRFLLPPNFPKRIGLQKKIDAPTDKPRTREKSLDTDRPCKHRTAASARVLAPCSPSGPDASSRHAGWIAARHRLQPL